MVNRVLVPLDGSEITDVALTYAEMLPGRQVKLLQLEPDAEGPLLAGVTEWEEWRATREATSHAYLVRAGARPRQQGRTVATSFAYGDPAAWIIAGAGDADLIVMTTHGRGGVRRWLLGSVADKLVRETAAPVLLVRAGSTPES